MTNTNMQTEKSKRAGSAAELLAGAEPVGLLAAVGPWSVRLRAGRRPAMEVYEYGELVDVVVESSLGGARLIGARRGRSPGRGPVVCAWGRLPHGAAEPPVRFLTGGLRRRAVDAELVRTAGRFWFASAAGEFRWAQVGAASCRAGRPVAGRAA